MKRYAKKCLKWCLCVLFICLVLVISKTFADFLLPSVAFNSVRSDAGNLQILARDGKPLEFSYHNQWNTNDQLALHQLPELLAHAFVLSEDKRFFEHQGVDWAARGNALWQRITENKSSRGASTITEQVVRMLHPRKRNYWSKWIEGLEAIALESSISKADILEFYLNQVPYSSNRRGVQQAARYYFNRDVNTLNTKEMLALTVLVRAPSKFDLYNSKVKLDDSIRRLAETLEEKKLLDHESVENLDKYDLQLNAQTLPVPAFHFVDFFKGHNGQQLWNSSRITTTLDSHLQKFVTDLLESRLKSLSAKNINNASAIVIDNATHEILAWVSVGSRCKETNNKASGCMIDMVTSPRQPGSALKPFLYAAALEKGWSAATVIEDAPYSEMVGRGIKHFHNYSNTYYGKVRLRATLGNSLNIPALHTINYVTPEHYLNILHNLEFQNLRKGADFYDDGLALGNGEVSLLELARAYVTLANRGVYEPLRVTFYNDAPNEKRRIYSEEVSSLIGNILSDPWARNLEFGRSSILNLPTQTAVKTGTSTDYRDAWAMGYNYRYTVGIWMGNTDYSPTDGITGSLGPSLALRSIFNELTKNSQTASLFLSPKLEARDICVDVEDDERQKPNCPTYTEYFIPGKDVSVANKSAEPDNKIRILRPDNGLEMAFDPRIPPEKQAFEMRLSGMLESDEVEWVIDGVKSSKVNGSKFLWPTAKGKHTAEAIVWRNGEVIATTDRKSFVVK
jgi:penicillin-binding protein 1C